MISIAISIVGFRDYCHQWNGVPILHLAFSVHPGRLLPPYCSCLGGQDAFLLCPAFVPILALHVRIEGFLLWNVNDHDWTLVAVAEV